MSFSAHCDGWYIYIQVLWDWNMSYIVYMLQIPASPQLIQVEPWYRSGPNGPAWACCLLLCIVLVWLMLFNCVELLKLWIICFIRLITVITAALIEWPSSPYDVGLQIGFYGFDWKIVIWKDKTDISKQCNSHNLFPLIMKQWCVAHKICSIKLDKLVWKCKM